MIIDDNNFLNHNYDEFVHVKALKNILKNTPDVTNSDVSEVTGMIVDGSAGTATITYIDNSGTEHTITLGSGYYGGQYIPPDELNNYVTFEPNADNVKAGFNMTLSNGFIINLRPDTINLTCWLRSTFDNTKTISVDPTIGTLTTQTGSRFNDVGIQYHPFFNGERFMKIQSLGKISSIQLVGSDPYTINSDNFSNEIFELNLLIQSFN